MEMNFFKGFIALSLVTLLVLIGTYWYQRNETSAADLVAEQNVGPAALDFASEDSSIHELDASAAEERIVSSGDITGDVVETVATSEGKTEEGNGAEALAVSPDETDDRQIGDSFLKNYLRMTYEDLIKTAGKPDQQTEKDSVQILYYNDVDIMGMKGRITVKLSSGKVRDASWYVNEGKASDYEKELKKLTEYLNDQYLQSETYQWVVDSFEWVGLDGIDTNEKLGIVFY